MHAMPVWGHVDKLLRLRKFLAGAPVEKGRVVVLRIAASRELCSLVGLTWRTYLEGRGDVVSGLLGGITRITTWVIRIRNLLTKSH